MLNKPKFMMPSTNKQECTIDIDADKIPFSCIVDGNEAIVAWQIVIYNLDDDVEVLNTDKVSLSTAFFPIDEKNRNVVFNVDLKEYVGDNTTFVNQQNEYYWTITFWGTSGNSTTSCQEVFYANATPDIKICYKHDTTDGSYTDMNDGTLLSSRSCTFKAIYSQQNADGTTIPLKRYGWRLIDTDSGQLLIDTISRNQIYGVADNIICSYNGLLNDGNYSIEVYIETQNNTTLTTTPIEFSVSYNTIFLSNDFKVEALKNEPAIMLDWNKSVVIGGKMFDKDDNLLSVEDMPFKENYPIIDYTAETPNTSIEIPSDYKVVFDYGSSSNLDIDENSYIVLSTQLPNGSDAILFEAVGIDEDGYDVMRRLSFSGGVFEYTVLGARENIAITTYQVENQPNQYVWYIIIMSPLLTNENGEYYAELTVVESKAINTLYPNVTLYPSTTLYPTFGIWDKLKEVSTDGV